MDKKELRAMIRQQKRAMTEEQIVSASRRLGELFRKHPMYQNAKTIYGCPHHPHAGTGAAGWQAGSRAQGFWR